MFVYKLYCNYTLTIALYNYNDHKIIMNALGDNLFSFL